MIVLTTFDADELVLRALRAGAAGFLLKDTPPAEIVRAIEHVHAGEGDALPGRHPAADRARRRRRRGRARRERPRAPLDDAHRRASTRSRWRSAAAASNAEIAAELHMSVATVKAHVSRLLVKLDVENRVQVALLVQDAS